MVETYYYRSGQRIPVILTDSARAARVEGERSDIQVEGWRQAPLTSKLVLLVNEELFAGREETMRVAGPRFLLKTVREHEQAVFRAERAATPEPLKDSPSRDAAHRVLSERPDLATFPIAIEAAGETTLICNGDVVAEFPDGVSRSDVDTIAQSENWVVAKTLSFGQNGFVFRASKSADPFTFANMLVERHRAGYAHPVFLEDIPKRSPTLSQPAAGTSAAGIPAWVQAAQFNRQWHLRNTGQGGSTPSVDIDAVGAWEFTNGAPGVIVCVLDSGVALSHPVFQSADKLLPGFDFDDQDPDPSPEDSNHGTACAALAVGGPGGQTLGVAPGCRLIPIRRPTLSNHLSIAEAFAWAADHGAAIITCSFGIDGRPWVLPDVVRSALAHVTSHGRAGRGCLVFWAAGNGNELVSSDEWASSMYTIAIAASTDQGQRAPYSDFGPQISICAPSSGGVNGIVTATNDDYTHQFGGTSAAAPIAAGVAALVLSLAPNMGWQEVRDLLERESRRIDPVGGQYDATGHSNYYGYGQIDARRALLGIDALLETVRVTGSTAQAGSIQGFVDYLRKSATGHLIANWVAARRMGVLLALQSSGPFRDAVTRVMRLMADAGSALDAQREVIISDDAWPAVEFAVRTLQSLMPLPRGGERSLTTKEAGMATDNRSLEEAFARIASMLGSSPLPATNTPATAPPTTPPPPTTPATTKPPTTPTSTDAPAFERSQREEIARQVFYSMNLPLITRETLLDMEKQLPTVIEELKSLASRPAARAEIQKSIEALKQQSRGTERDAGKREARDAAFAEMLRGDAFGEGERFLPLIGVAIAAFMAGYTVVHNWNE